MLLDTCIVIDLTRGQPAAMSFINALPETPALSAVTATELLGGVRSPSEKRHVDEILASYVILDIGLEVARLAGDYVREYGRSHGVDTIDALIAATAKQSGLGLATLNLKHFPMFKGLKRPYPA